jgi:hypothetical protein
MLRFEFTLDGRPADGDGDMRVTYVGRVSRKQAEADARRRFEEWCGMANQVARRFARDQVVLA